ncbi:MAG TPA: RIP metalloprotease RseP [Alphaproteobacteria bacterium]|nr:RIP metalloprotease RseP [Alphaproteobacteria bacterium]
MDFILSALQYVVPFLVVLTVLVFVHEMGHFWIARRNGVRVEVFSIGFGPEIVGWTDRHQTRWKISALPLGGYVRMFGDANAMSEPDEAVQAMTPEERAVSFHHKRVGQRAAVVVAGPVANFLLAIFAFACLFSIVGQPFTSPLIGQVDPDSAAARAGFEPGDRIMSINGTRIERFQQVIQIVEVGLGEPLTIEVAREGKTATLHAVPDVIERRDNFGHRYQIGRLGLRAKGVEYVRYDPLSSLWRATEETGSLSMATLKAIGQMVAGTRSTDELQGPIGIGKMAGDVAEGGIVPLVWFLAVLSLNLGLINILPIPMLDGGHLLFYALEAIRRRPLAPRVQDYGFRIGLTLVFLLMVFATWNDLVHLKVIQFVTGLIS